MDDFENEIKNEFLSEALMNLEEVEGAFVELENSSNPLPLIEKIFRLANNLKGGSRAVGFGDVAEFTHEFETFVLKIKKGQLAVTGDTVTILLLCKDHLANLVRALQKDINHRSSNEEILRILKNCELTPSPSTMEATELNPIQAPQTPGPELGNETIERVEASASTATEAPILPSPTTVSEIPKPAPAAASSEVNHGTTNEDEVVRVRLSRINKLNDFVGELLVLQSVVSQQGLQCASPQLLGSIRQTMKLTKEIQSMAMSLRMLPIKPLITKLQRVVRDVSRELKKEITFTVVGEHLEVDKSVLDTLADPLIHLIRNSADHGIEDAETRARIGKPTNGNIILTFSNEGNHLVVQVRDDGKGLDPEFIVRRAKERGLIASGLTLEKDQALNLIFLPGFSTKTEASEISGRGVGMDVVKTNLEKIGGQIELQSEVGLGSTMTLKIPLSLAVVDGLIVSSSGQRYVIPIGYIQETVNLAKVAVHLGASGAVRSFDLRGRIVPIIRIEAALQNRIESSGDLATGLIINHSGRLAALAVDDILKAQQIVIKPIQNGLRAQRGWIGTCILGDGQPTLILNPLELLAPLLIGGAQDLSEKGVA